MFPVPPTLSGSVTESQSGTEASLPAIANGYSADDVLTVAEAATFLKVAADRLLAEAISGWVPAKLVAGEWRFNRRALLRWLSTPPATKPQSRSDFVPAITETPEEEAAFLASLHAFRDEVDRATGSGRYAPE